MRVVSITLGPDLQEEYHSYIDCCLSLEQEPNINRFLSYIDYFGTYNHPHLAND